MSRPKALISWSSGKDSAFALHEVRRAGEFEVVGALTTVTETFGRVSIHGVGDDRKRAGSRFATVDQIDAAATFAGRKFDARLLADLPEGIDPCGRMASFIPAW